MSKTIHPTAVLKGFLPIAAALVLSGCSANHDWTGREDAYVEPLHYERHPIEVSRGTMKLRLSTGAPHLSRAQENVLLRFSDEARGAATGAIIISRPGGSRNAEIIASKAGQALARRGIGGPSVRYVTYRGGRHDPVVVAYSRTFASVAECGDWSESLSTTGLNEPYPNFGCAQQHNIAALVANPEDIVTPRAQTPPDAMRRQQVITDYRVPKATATPIDDKQTATVSQVGQQ